VVGGRLKPAAATVVKIQILSFIRKKIANRRLQNANKKS
jgi:hypothetical protein